MPALNDSLVFVHAPAGVRQAFQCGTARRHEFAAGWELFKFTGFEAFQPDRRGNRSLGTPLSPWWCSILPVPGTDIPGLDDYRSQADQLGLSMLEYAREYLAVMHSWNSLADTQMGLAKIQKVKLQKPVYGFYGKVQRQANDRVPLRQPGRLGGRSFLAGGAIQIWIPNLTSEFAMPCGTIMV
ncbi:MAG TPA: hypothetical protein PKD86_17645 [Gemmatales bacterium]|nr:hypothetical protein [Gemmatales bacterium]HMP61171.1 hypothetical protein [Gemmatales bacterium]